MRSKSGWADLIGLILSSLVEESQRILGIVWIGVIGFFAQQLTGVAYRWWQTYELGRPASATPLIWHRFSILFLEKFIPQTRCRSRICEDLIAIASLAYAMSGSQMRIWTGTKEFANAKIVAFADSRVAIFVILESLLRLGVRGWQFRKCEA
nr:uncharacterized protein LOC117278456 [Nicotiana tomentosiformis]